MMGEWGWGVSCPWLSRFSIRCNLGKKAESGELGIGSAIQRFSAPLHDVFCSQPLQNDTKLILKTKLVLNRIFQDDHTPKSEAHGRLMAAVPDWFGSHDDTSRHIGQLLKQRRAAAGRRLVPIRELVNLIKQFSRQSMLPMF